MHTIDVLTWYISNNMLLCRPHKEILAPDQKATPSTNGPPINDVNILGGGVKTETENMKGPGGGGGEFYPLVEIGLTDRPNILSALMGGWQLQFTYLPK